MPQVSFANTLASAAIITKAADLEAIAKACTKGYMATNELYELTKDENLKGIDPQDTQIIDIRVDTTNGTIDFLFKLTPSPWGWLTFAIIFMSFATMIGIVICLRI